MNDLIQEQTREQLQAFASKHGPKVIVPATVLAVNNDDTVHVQFSDDSEIDDVRLKSVVKAGNKFILVPKVGSVVQVAMIENSDECLVIAVEEITEVKVVIDNLLVSIDSVGLLFQKDGDSLKKIFDDLFTQINALTVPTNVGPSGTPLNAAAFTAIKERVQKILR